MRRITRSAFALGLLFGCGGGDDDGGGPLFEQQVECEGASIDPLAGSHQQVISFIEIGGRDDGFQVDLWLLARGRVVGRAEPDDLHLG